MDRTLQKIADFFVTEPARVSACLRLPMIALVAALVQFGQVDHWLPIAYGLILAAYGVAATMWLWLVSRRQVPRWAAAASVVADVFVLVLLCIASGGATSWLLPVFFLLPISLAFQESWLLTAVVGLAGALGYLVVWVIYSKRDDEVGLPVAVYIHVAFLVWLAAATTALALVLARRSNRVAALLEARRRLVAESTKADERHNRELAEQLHDGPLQTLLAARLEVEEVRERYPDPALDSVHWALHDTATRLRSAVTALHPQVLAELGLTAALRELVRQYQYRSSFTIESELDEVGRLPAQEVLYRAARELLANAHKHSQATAVSVRLANADGATMLTVEDDGIGFDPSILDQCVAKGHIGLASLVVNIEALGGSLDFERPTTGGTRATVIVPAEPS